MNSALPGAFVRSALALALLLPGCIGDKPTFPEVADAGMSAPVADDPPTARDGERCAPTAPFVRVENLAEINSGEDETTARLSADQKTLYYTHRVIENRPFEIRVAARARIDHPFVPQGTLPVLGGTSSATLTASGDRLYFVADINDDPQLFVATPPFSQATSRMIAELSSSVQEVQPYVSAAGSALYFVRRPNGVTDVRADIYASAIVDGRYAAPAPVAGVNTVEAHELAPVLSADELRLYFASDRAGGFGDMDIYLATRSDPSAPFGAAVALAELNTPQHEQPTWISADDCTLYLSSKRPGNGGLDVWRASRR